ncbi:MAG: argininosuccinate lyase, partial [Candidatus Hadarchaeota archaeon]|nr:argininosuccinate lyase [Candidatus Hadarchaeota archaeon]
IRALELKPELEDIHLAVEKYVIDDVGEKVGGKLHTAKSRNDQVAAAIRMGLRREILEIRGELLGLIGSTLKLARRHTKTIMPGYTHLQVAQPTTFAHYLLAYTWHFSRDLDRLSQAYVETNSCPMGACALAGTGFSVDRRQVAQLLGFDGVAENTMDAVGSRDFALQAMSSLAVLMMSLSRLAEELVLWSSAEFDMVELPEEFASPSSIMPQKKNPVVAEIARAKAGRSVGNLTGALFVMKALPQSYSLDLQELTPLLWDAVDQTKATLGVISRVVNAVKPKRGVMRKRAEEGFAAATELADVLVREADLSFREAHAVVGRMVTEALREGKSMRELKVDDLQAASRRVLRKGVQLSEGKMRKALDLEECVKKRSLPGGPAPGAVRKQLNQLRKVAEKHRKAISERKKALAKAEKSLSKSARRKVS